MITLKNIHFRYAGSADAGGLSDVSLTIPDGQVVLLCGPSGCGKTTVTRLINGLIPHFYEGELTGEVYVNGEAVSRLPLYQTARMVGSVFQNPRTQFFTVDSTSEMAFGCENQGLAEEVIRERILSTADRFGLQGLLGKSIFEMSGGEKQKVACASVAVSDPPVIVLDEPSSNLDVSATMELRRMLSVWKKQGKTILIAEHRLYYLVGLLDRIVYMKEGRICAEYTEREMRKIPVQEQIKMGLRSFELSKFPVKHRREVADESIVLSDFTFSYRKKEALVKIDRLTLPKGAVVALIGHNGAGKSTLARCLCGLEKGAGGRLEIGSKTYGRRKRLKSCYMVMQDVNHQLFTESVYEETAISMTRPDEEEISKILQKLGLEAFANRHPMSLSGGQKQRTAIAGAVVSDRELVVFDEPTSGLDLKHMAKVGELLLQLRRMGRTVLVITHDYELIACCCSYVLHLEHGQVQEQYVLDEEGMGKLKDFFKVS